LGDFLVLRTGADVCFQPNLEAVILCTVPNDMMQII